jgi:hypothetical protein
MLYISFVGYEKRVYVYLMMIGETLVYLWRKLAKYVAKVEILAKEKVEIYVLAGRAVVCGVVSTGVDVSPERSAKSS